ncbi:MAG: fumarylacetoacetase, partial [Acidimicrobiales bacterium]
MTDRVASWVPVADDSPFPVQNLPLGIGTADDDPRAWVAIGDHALDLAAVQDVGLLDDLDLPEACFAEDALNSYLAAGRTTWTATRARLTELLTEPAHASTLEPLLAPRVDLSMR